MPGTSGHGRHCRVMIAGDWTRTSAFRAWGNPRGRLAADSRLRPRRPGPLSSTFDSHRLASACSRRRPATSWPWPVVERTPRANPSFPCASPEPSDHHRSGWTARIPERHRWVGCSAGICIECGPPGGCRPSTPLAPCIRPRASAARCSTPCLPLRTAELAVLPWRQDLRSVERIKHKNE